MAAQHLDILVQEFAACVVAQGEAIEHGNAKTGNEYARRYIAAFDRLREHGDTGRDALVDLLAHKSASVRVMAATFLLRHCNSKARAVLEVEAKETGLVAFGAQQALQRWDEGAWSLDPE